MKTHCLQSICHVYCFGFHWYLTLFLNSLVEMRAIARFPCKWIRSYYFKALRRIPGMSQRVYYTSYQIWYLMLVLYQTWSTCIYTITLDYYVLIIHYEAWEKPTVSWSWSELSRRPQVYFPHCYLYRQITYCFSLTPNISPLSKQTENTLWLSKNSTNTSHSRSL